MNNQRVKYKKGLDVIIYIACMVLMYFSALDGQALAAIMLVLMILGAFVFAYESFSNWVNKGDNNEDNL